MKRSAPGIACSSWTSTPSMSISHERISRRVIGATAYAWRTMAGPDESPVNATLRRDRMLAAIRERDFVRVGELSERFGISEVTVRSDLDALALRGEVHRIRGGAIPRTLPGKEGPVGGGEASLAQGEGGDRRAA